jgi:acetate---CoA ligase (ADP-forming)
LISEQAGILVVNTLEELVDLAQLLLQFPQAQPGGLGVVTGSGAICVITQDYVEELNLEMPALSEDSTVKLRAALPAYLSPKNPLDVGTLIGWEPQLLGTAATQILSDPGIGSLVISLPWADPEMSVGWLRAYLDAHRGSLKPAIYVIHGEDRPLAPALVELAHENKVVLMRSHERALRALAQLARFANNWREDTADEPVKPFSGLPDWPTGNVSEWLGKASLLAMGIRVPQGALVKTVDEAVSVATGVGYPVVIKAQAADLAHKSEAGGVLLNLRDAQGVRAAWEKLHENIKRYAPDLRLDGVLVEAMSPPGLELVVGATRDPQWGPILMIGLGGIWIEALGDVRLLPPNASRAVIVQELTKLKAHKLLQGFRGSRAVDLDAVASVAQQVGRLMLTQPEVMEVDINPLIVYPQGQGAMALDALIVTRAK